MLRLDHSAALPLRAQVEALLRDMLKQKEYREGAMLPDEMKLAAQLGVSRGTVRAGISKLVFEGLLERKAGVGTRVCNHRAESAVHAWRSFTREMADKGIVVQNFWLDYRQVEASDAASLGLQLTAPGRVWRLSRVRGWDGKPVLHSTSWFHPRLGLKGGENFDKPLYEVIEEVTDVRPHHAFEKFLAISADTRMARMLKVTPRAPLLLRQHTVFDVGRRPIEFAEVCYVSSRFPLTFDLRRQDG